MINRGILTTFTFIIAAALIFAACDVMSEKGIEESLAPYTELESITEGTTSAIVVHKGDSKNMDSFFTYDVTDVFENGLIRKGAKEAWCVEWEKPLDSNGKLHEEIEFFSTYGSDKWKPANYLLTNKNKLKKEFENISYKEIQVALWSVIENPDFDLDEVLKDGKMPARMMKDGRPDFDIKKVKEIIGKVKSHYNEYQYKPSKPFMVYTKTKDSDQNGGFLTCDQTAWAANGDQPADLRYNDQGNWATYTEYNGEEKTVTLFAGQYIDIGTVTYSAPVDGKVTITIELNEDGDFYDDENNVKIQDYENAPSGNPAPGQFDHKGTASGDSFSIEVPENNYYGVHVDALTECEEEENDDEEEED